MVAVIHVPDESYRLSCRILYQYLLLAQGQYHDLKVSHTPESGFMCMTVLTLACVGFQEPKLVQDFYCHAKNWMVVKIILSVK